ncbi:hypothetical protein [Thermostichus vulcanus]|uniref:DUF2281 domain-containing protein n=1 Tax=Thermostichus vulcanus str. 'Rupite' TaxID=2813851 RepID=A0ABT0C9W2_THEVL|nr:hypothetical protein [Thermostichus vulcanus]MCJ2542140.1 hypothetical protein [Thermostichus vulcanus str. 'Rupite']
MSSQLQTIFEQMKTLTPEENLELIRYAEQLLQERQAVSPIWQAYLQSKQERREVYNRLAES